jgi:hypothetical protein
MQFNLVICEIHNKDIHGFHETYSDPDVKGHYLCRHRINATEFFELGDDDDDIAWHKQFYYNNVNNLYHDFIQNYKDIILLPNYLKPEIAMVIELRGGERVAILKTFWLRIIQRAWKKVFNQRMIILNKRQLFNSIKYRELNGKWPTDCDYLPGLHGLLNR